MITTYVKWGAIVASVAFVVASCGGGAHGSGFSGGDDAGGDQAVSSSGGSSGNGGFTSSGVNNLPQPDGGGPCVNLQCVQVDCSSRGLAADATTVSGVVYDPAGKNPVYNAIVYVPNEPPKALASGVVCDQCGVLTTGNPVVSALSDATGHFQLRNVPPGMNIPLVIQVGKWRRQTKITSVAACSDNPLTDRNLTRLPANQSEGDMPQIALATGGCDAFECLLRTVGIADSEFTPASGSGHVHVYKGYNGMGLYQSTASTDLWSNLDKMKKYDLIVNSCECSENYNSEKTAAMIQNHVDYVNAGGRVFDTHYNYYWITNASPPVPTTASFVMDQLLGNVTATVDTSFPKGDALATWLVATGASTTKGQLPLVEARVDVSSVNPPSTRWIYGSTAPGNGVFHYTFNTPVGAADNAQCGKVLFSDFHAAASSNIQYTPFPTECSSSTLLPQAAALEFMLFDLSSCIQRDTQLPMPPPVL
jgi:hypothetical protein